MSAGECVEEMVKSGIRGSIIVRAMYDQGFNFRETVYALIMAGFIIWCERDKDQVCLHVSNRPFKDEADLIQNYALEVPPTSFVWPMFLI